MTDATSPEFYVGSETADLFAAARTIVTADPYAEPFGDVPPPSHEARR